MSETQVRRETAADIPQARTLDMKLEVIVTRLPGRVETDTTFASSTELATALRRAAAAHGEHEKRTGKPDANWPDWYADYIVREQGGKELPS
jgi:hypothetical protein